MIEAPGVEQLAALINFSVDAVVLVDIGGIVRWANPATISVLGYAPAELIGLRVRDIVEPPDLAAWQQLVRQLFDHPDAPQTGAFRCRHRDGGARRRPTKHSHRLLNSVGRSLARSHSSPASPRTEQCAAFLPNEH